VQPRIPLNDLGRLHAPLRAAFAESIDRVLSSGWFLRGRETSRFEAEWADYCGQKYCVTCASGTDALTLAALGLGLERATLQANTLPLSAIGLHRAGVSITLSDVDSCGRTLSTGPDTVPVLLYGRLPQASEIGRQLYDAAHAHGWKPHKGATACWSFYPTKTLGALGDGGAITTNDQGLADLLRDLAGRDDVFRNGRQMTSRLDELQAAILSIKLKHLDSWIGERQQIAHHYATNLPTSVVFVSDPELDLQHLAVVRVSERDALSSWLDEHGVDTKVHFPLPLHKQDAPWGGSQLPFSATDDWCSSILTLPCFPGLTQSELSTVTGRIVEFFDCDNKRGRS
jgi:dTDP-3-amino-2,3,6-trideoxy-4-keto-D-glucose/dTDP-3-amino-3,4,6-trideoxy-alpha-D-glucose/dTDP-2,6-dideoxy-D-kanosamine transaminase